MNEDKNGVKIFQGVKFFWRTRNSLDIIIIEHKSFNVTELIAYEPTIDREAPRLYLNTALLRTKIDHTSVDAQLSFAKRNNVSHTEEWIEGIYNKAKADYLLNRLFITEFSSENKVIKVEVQISSIAAESDADAEDKVSLMCERPTELRPFHSPHYATLMEGVISQALAAFETEKKSLQAHTDMASAYHAQAVHSGLTVRQRWRIPILFVKVSKGRRLNAEDTKIWQHVTANIESEADAQRLAGVFDPAVVAAATSGAAALTAKKQAASAAAAAASKPKSTSPSPKLSPKNSPKNSPKSSPRPSGQSGLYRANTASSQRRLLEEEMDRTPPVKMAKKSSKKKGKAVSPKNGAASSKRNSTGKKSPKRRNQSLDGSSVVKASSSGDTDAQDEQGVNIDGDEPDDCEDADAEMQSTLDRFVSTIGSFSTSIKQSFSFGRQVKVLPTDEEGGDEDDCEDVTPTADHPAADDKGQGRYAPSTPTSPVARDIKAGMPLLVINSTTIPSSKSTTQLSDSVDVTPVGAGQGLAPSLSILAELPAPTAKRVPQKRASFLGSFLGAGTYTGSGDAADGDGPGVNVSPAKAKPQKRASFLGSFLTLGAYAGNTDAVADRGSPGLVESDEAAAGNAGGSGPNSRAGSRKNVLSTITQLFGGLWGRKTNSNHDLNADNASVDSHKSKMLLVRKNSDLPGTTEQQWHA